MVSDVSARVLLVHGTFSADVSPSGEKWWQVGSAFRRALSEKTGLRESEPPTVFHWSGENLESERRNAAYDLADLLQTWERTGQPYHLVGHSHGGSVVWGALQELVRRGNQLHMLLSWCTVGTPFLRFGNRGAVSWVALRLLVAAVCLALTTADLAIFRTWAPDILGGVTAPSTAMIEIVLGALLVVLIGGNGIVLAASLSAARTGRRFAMAGVLLATAAVAILSVRLAYAAAADAEELRVWAGVAPAAAFLTSWLVSAGIFATVALAAVSVATGRLATRNADRIAVRALQLVQDRYLGLWSHADEAINGLMGTLTAPPPIVPRRPERARGLGGRMLAALTGPFRVTYNGWMAPVSDEFVWDRITKRLQGNDTNRFVVSDIRREPAPGVPAFPIPVEAESQLLALADAEGAALLPLARKLLGSAATAFAREATLVSVLAEAGPDRDAIFKGLIHTNYFASDELAGLIATHIRGGAPHEAGAAANSVLASPATSRSRLSAAAFLLLAAVAIAALVTNRLLFGTVVYPHTNEFAFHQAISRLPLLFAVSPGIEQPAPTYVAALASAGEARLAESTIASIEDETVQASCYLALAAALAKSHSFDSANRAVGLAFSRIGRAPSNAAVDLFRDATAAASALIDAGRPDLAASILAAEEQLVPKVPRGNNRASALNGMVDARLRLHDQASARRLVRLEVDNVLLDDGAAFAADTADALRKLGERDRAAAFLRTVLRRFKKPRDDPFHGRAIVLAEIGAELMLLKRDIRQAETLIEAALRDVRGETSLRDRAIGEVAEMLARFDQDAFVIRAARAEPRPSARYVLLRALFTERHVRQSAFTQRITDRELLGSWTESAEHIADRSTKTSALANIADVYHRFGDARLARRFADAASTAAAEIGTAADRPEGGDTPPTKRALALVRVAQLYEDLGARNDEWLALGRAEKIASRAQGADFARSYIRAPVARQLVRARAYRRAIDLCESCSSEDRLSVYTAILEDWTATRQIAEKLRRSQSRSSRDA
ncbi:MAG TPA: hypothetical protein VGD01_14645 [Candidatus Elarobacter sp.]|jgi:hypothetical protein